MRFVNRDSIYNPMLFIHVIMVSGSRLEHLRRTLYSLRTRAVELLFSIKI